MCKITKIDHLISAVPDLKFTSGDHLWLGTIYSYISTCQHVNPLFVNRKTIGRLHSQASLTAARTDNTLNYCPLYLERPNFKAIIMWENPLVIPGVYRLSCSFNLEGHSFLHLSTILLQWQILKVVKKYMYTSVWWPCLTPNGGFWGQSTFERGTCKHS